MTLWHGAPRCLNPALALLKRFSRSEAKVQGHFKQ